MSDVSNGMSATELTEVSGARWVKSSRSGPTGGNCVEVAAGAAAGRVMVRDSKDTGGPVLDFSPEAWRLFTTGVVAII